jgi:predicted lactoylglutathione lyase
MSTTEVRTDNPTDRAVAAKVDMKFEIVVIPVSDIDRAKEFYTAIEDVAEQEYLMKIPTTLYLTGEQIDRLLLAASRLIRNDPEFQRLMKDLQASS